MFRRPQSMIARQLAAFVFAVGLAGGSQAQTSAATTVPTPGFASRQVLVAPITGFDAKQVVLVAVTLEPGASSPLHMHPGDCHGSVLEGAIELKVQGQEPRRIAAGESYSTMASVPHQFTNTGDKPARLLNTLVVDKGKPATSAASAPGR